MQQMDRELCTAADYTVCIKGLHKTDDPAEMHRWSHTPEKALDHQV